MVGWWYYNSAQILWTLAFKDYVSGTSENANVTDAITAAWNENQNFTLYVKSCLYAVTAKQVPI
jgi:hypothetical protein